MGDFSKKDLGILYELTANSRSPLNKIAKKLKMSQQGLGYRISKLQQEGTILAFYTLFDYSCFGYQNYRVFLNVNHTKQENLEPLLQYLSNQSCVVSIIECGGKWDLIIAFATKNASRFKKELHALMARFPKLIRNYSVLTTIVMHELGRKYLVDHSAHTGTIIVGGDRDHMNVDRIDNKLMHDLYENPRTAYVHMAAKHKLTPKTVIMKIKNLETKGIIKGYSSVVDCGKYSFLAHKILIRYHNLSLEKEDELMKFCRQHKNVLRFSKVLGEWDVELDTETKDTLELQKICLTLRRHFGEIIKDMELCPVFKSHKSSYIPQSFFLENI